MSKVFQILTDEEVLRLFSDGVNSGLNEDEAFRQVIEIDLKKISEQLYNKAFKRPVSTNE